MKALITVTIAVAVFVVPLTAMAYNYPGYKWGVQYVGMDTSPLRLSSWRSSATDAMNSWNNAGARLQFINYSPSNNTVGYYYEQSRTLAYARRYRTGVFWGNIYRGTISVNYYHNFNPPYNSGTWYDLRSVLRHEFGHLVPLDHVDMTWALMYPTTNAWEVKHLSSDEVNGIRAIYGAR